MALRLNREDFVIAMIRVCLTWKSFETFVSFVFNLAFLRASVSPW
jgi:hypothetical protein